MTNIAKLILEDGSVFEGQSQGAKVSAAGEVVFTTGMVGYEQSLTDPSYAGQILTFTYPLIGNWGVPKSQFWESEKIWASGLIVSDLTQVPNHWQSQQTLDSWLKDQNIPAISGIDTRRLTQKLRTKGVMLGKIVTNENDVDFYDPNSENLIANVSPKELKIHYPNSLGSGQWDKDQLNPNPHTLKVGLLNCGAKTNIIRSLLKRNFTVYNLPYNFDPFANNLPIDGLVISNGPGDPKMAKDSVAVIKKSLDKKIPTFGICLGNQLLTLAAGGNTYKLKFGHRAQNQPTIQSGSNRCYITTQNHGFAVDETKLPSGFTRWFYNANDNTNEGLIHKELPFFSVQFHPEATPGPTDTEFLFDFFKEKFK